jgi:hypothetical protein
VTYFKESTIAFVLRDTGGNLFRIAFSEVEA